MVLLYDLIISEDKRKSRSDDRPIERTFDILFLSFVFLTDNQFTVLPGILTCRFSAFFTVRGGEPDRQTVFIDHIFYRTFREDAIQAGKLRETLGKRCKPLLQVCVERVDAGLRVCLVEYDDRFPLFLLYPMKTPPFLELGRKKKPIG